MWFIICHREGLYKWPLNLGHYVAMVIEPHRIFVMYLLDYHLKMTFGDFFLFIFAVGVLCQEASISQISQTDRCIHLTKLILTLSECLNWHNILTRVLTKKLHMSAIPLNAYRIVYAQECSKLRGFSKMTESFSTFLFFSHQQKVEKVSFNSRAGLVPKKICWQSHKWKLSHLKWFCCQSRSLSKTRALQRTLKYLSPAAMLHNTAPMKRNHPLFRNWHFRERLSMCLPTALSGSSHWPPHHHWILQWHQGQQGNTKCSRGLFYTTGSVDF